MNVDVLIEKLRRDEQNPNARHYRRKYMSAAVLTIDEFGLQALARKDAHLLFKVISDRYERGSTLITSNKSISMWPDMLAGDEILDCVLHHCHVFSVDGRSFRLKEMEAKVTNR